MNIRKNTVSRLLAVVGVTAVVVVGAVSPSLAESNDGGPINYRIFDNNDKATVEQSTTKRERRVARKMAATLRTVPRGSAEFCYSVIWS